MRNLPLPSRCLLSCVKRFGIRDHPEVFIRRNPAFEEPIKTRLTPRDNFLPDHRGALEYSDSTPHHYVNLGKLFYKERLPELTAQISKSLLELFVRSTLLTTYKICGADTESISFFDDWIYRSPCDRLPIRNLLSRQHPQRAFIRKLYQISCSTQVQTGQRTYLRIQGFCHMTLTAKNV